MEHWIRELLVGLDNSVNEETKEGLLEKCGPRCPFSHMPDDKLLELREQSGTEQDFLNKLSAAWRLKRENDQYFVVFDQCYCPLVNKDLEHASPTMCYCTLGSLKHKFRVSLGRDIEVIMLGTVLRGEKECRFEIKI